AGAADLRTSADAWVGVLGRNDVDLQYGCWAYCGCSSGQIYARQELARSGGREVLCDRARGQGRAPGAVHMSPWSPKAGGGPLRLGILLSGRGSNFKAIANSIHEGRLKGVEIAVVISNVAEVAGLVFARESGFKTALFASKGRRREEHDAGVADCLRAHQ